MTTSSLLSTAFGAAIAATLFMGSPAQALEPKQCLPIAEMNAALRADGQRTLILGNREALQNPTGQIKDASVDQYANAVISSADGSLGYQLEGDLPRAQPSTSMCVVAKLTNVRLFDARRGGMPNAVMLGGKFDQVVRELDQSGSHAMLIADTFRGEDATRHGNPFVVFSNVSGRSGTFATMTSAGPQRLALLGDVDYTPEALRRLEPTLAMR